MHRTSLANLVVALGVAATACDGKVPAPADTDVDTVDTEVVGDRDGDGPDTDGVDTDTNVAADTDLPGPAKPILGAQLDRVGRPGVNSMLNSTFTPELEHQDAFRDAYNADADSWAWSLHASNFGLTLRKLDALDGTCGNQIGASEQSTGATYTLMAGVFADDRVYVNAAGLACAEVLAVELNSLGLRTSADCGGRPMGVDVLDTLLGFWITGLATGTGDGIPVSQPTPDFPYLAAPR